MDSVTIGAFSNSKYLDSNKYEVTLKALPAGGKTKVFQAFKMKIAEGTPVNSEIKMGFTLKGQGIPVSQIKTSFVTKEQYYYLQRVFTYIRNQPICQLDS